MILLFVGILGLIFGSFFNVVIYRLPLEMEFAKSRSCCPNCKTLIPWYLNIPVLSYLFLKGKCHHCKKTISIQYPLVEIVTSLLWVLVFLQFGLTLQTLGYWILVSYLWIITVIDYHHQIIPDELSLSGIVLGFIFCLIVKEPTWIESLIGIFIGGGSFFLIAYLYEKMTKREGLGGGDIKLLAMLGAWFGVHSILPIIVVSSLLGSIVGIFLMLLKNKNFKTAIPFGPFLAVASLIYLFFQIYIQNYLYPA
jgi:leader peptidase (prepilin peptidase)/N-methyltransferase